MRIHTMSTIALIIGLLNWLTIILIEKVLVKHAEISMVYSLGVTLSGYSLFSGLVSVLMLIFSLIGYKKRRNIAVLILNIIVNGSYLAYYVSMINQIISM